MISNSLFADLIHTGDEGRGVSAIQEQLSAFGFDLGTFGADGDFGSFTETAVKSFQLKASLPITGIVDPATMAKLSATG